MRMLILLIVSMFLALPAQAHSQEESDEWIQTWIAKVHEQGALTIARAIEYFDFNARHQHVASHHPPPVVLSPEQVEVWRPLVGLHFYPEDINMALRILWCESRGDANAKNPTSTASGLFQHLRFWWSGQSAYPAFDPFDPNESVKAAAYLRYTRGNWGDWNPSKHCWGG